jgi:hypothetical protein
MRRALLAVLAGGTLLTGAACDGGAKSTADQAPASSITPSRVPDETLPPLPDYSADTKQVCTKLQTVYSGELKAFGTAMGKMVSYKEAKQAAQAQTAENAAAGQLKAAGTKIRQETAAAADPDLKAAGATSATKFERSSQDRKYFDRVKTLKDLDSTLQTQMATWLTPVAGYCESPS